MDAPAAMVVPLAGSVALHGALGGVVDEIVSMALPVLRTVRLLVAVVPTVTDPNATEVGATDSTGAGTGVPVPVTLTVALPPLVVKLTDELDDMAVVGAYCTGTAM